MITIKKYIHISKRATKIVKSERNQENYCPRRVLAQRPKPEEASL